MAQTHGRGNTVAQKTHTDRAGAKPTLQHTGPPNAAALQRKAQKSPPGTGPDGLEI